MAQSLGSNTQFAYVKETTPGTTPTSPAMNALYGVQSETLTRTKGLVSDNALRPSGMKKFARLGNEAVGGNITFSYAPGTQDALIEAGMYGTWTTNVLKLGTTENSYTIEVGHLNTSLYTVYKGMHVSEMTLNVPSGNQLATLEVGFTGMSGTVPSGTALDATLTAPSIEGVPFIHLDGTFTLDGSPAAYITGLQVKVGNALTANHSWGTAVARSVTKGTSTVTGQVTAYFESAALATMFFGEVYHTLSFTLSDGTNSHTHLLPRVLFLTHNAPVNGDGPVVVTATFEAFEDSTEGTAYKITRA